LRDLSRIDLEALLRSRPESEQQALLAALAEDLQDALARVGRVMRLSAGEIATLAGDLSPRSEAAQFLVRSVTPAEARAEGAMSRAESAESAARRSAAGLRLIADLQEASASLHRLLTEAALRLRQPG
jgi:hypothetical protein